MNTRLLIDAIVQQTMVLIAQLSTASGVRSPLSHVADQVFLSLAHEIEQQGVGRKVVADMFGLALRSYQRKVQRLTESESVHERTLWEAVLEHINEHGPVGRKSLVERFRHDDELALSAVLSDLVGTGLVYSSGRGEATVYGVTTEAARRELEGDAGDEAAATLVWGTVFHRPGVTVSELCTQSRLDEASTRAALSNLLADGRVRSEGDGDGARLYASPFVIRAGDAQGWEAAVFDHYQAMANAIASKVRLRGEGSSNDARVGGSTLHFGLYPGHPYEDEVYESLQRVRREMNALWDRVVAYNEAHPIPDERATRVTFYFGQYVREPADSRAAGDSEMPPTSSEMDERG